MIWRRLLYWYIVFAGTILWLGWVLLQTAFKGKLRHPPVDLGDPALEEASTTSCFKWALWRFIQQGGELHLYSSPRIPVWRTEWTAPDGVRWHFEPVKPRRGVPALWHSYWHKGKPKRMN